jgi:hypothetical protein
MVYFAVPEEVAAFRLLENGSSRASQTTPSALAAMSLRYSFQRDYSVWGMKAQLLSYMKAKQKSAELG